VHYQRFIAETGDVEITDTNRQFLHIRFVRADLAIWSEPSNSKYTEGDCSNDGN
jgi:hypothetical protein